jgi:hypothetical protein
MEAVVSIRLQEVQRGQVPVVLTPLKTGTVPMQEFDIVEFSRVIDGHVGNQFP